MRSSDEARRAILRSIRDHLAASAPHDALHDERLHSRSAAVAGGLALPVLTHAMEPAVEVADAPPSDPMARFRLALEAVGATWVSVPNAAAAAGEVARILREAGARRVATTDAPLARGVSAAAALQLQLQVLESPSQDELFHCDAGVTAAQWGIAETGTLVLESARERSRLASLIPPVHVALLHAADICATLGDALARVRAVQTDGTLANRCVTFVTGPSRTSDIELTLAIGVHGPQALHVVLIDHPAAADPA